MLVHFIYLSKCDLEKTNRGESCCQEEEKVEKDRNNLELKTSTEKEGISDQSNKMLRGKGASVFPIKKYKKKMKDPKKGVILKLLDDVSWKNQD